eukprot:COSAG02_NODE_6492_length_3539_cov_1.962209_2_plen_658_part_00
MEALSCDSLAAGGCSGGVCDACCSAVSHDFINATLLAMRCTACVAHECGDAPQFEKALQHVATFLTAHTEALLTLLAALPIAGRLSDHFLARVRRRLCPKRKVVVMSCPEKGTLRPDGAEPYDQEVMEKVAELQRRGLLKMGFDRAGSSTKAPEDDGLDWSDPQDIKRSRWMYGFRTAAKKVMAVECQSFDGIVVVVCIFGGPITRVEHELMGSIIEEAKRDAAQSHIDCHIERSDLSYAQFVREYDEGWLSRVLCCWMPRCARRQLLQSHLASQLVSCLTVCCQEVQHHQVQHQHHTGCDQSQEQMPLVHVGNQVQTVSVNPLEIGSSERTLQRLQLGQHAQSLHELGLLERLHLATEDELKLAGLPLLHVRSLRAALVAADSRLALGLQPEPEPEPEPELKFELDAAGSSSASSASATGEGDGSVTHSPRPARRFTNYRLNQPGSSWAAARDGSGLSPHQAAGRAALRLFAWHLLQPALYFYVFVDALSGLDEIQRVLGALVGVREGAYALSVLACVVVNPAFLLVDVGATVRERFLPWSSGYRWLVVYVVAPEKFVMWALTSEGGLDLCDGSCFTVLIIVVFLLDLCGMVALIIGLAVGHLPLPLAVGYSITTIGALSSFAFVSYEDPAYGLYYCVMGLAFFVFVWGMVAFSLE